VGLNDIVKRPTRSEDESRSGGYSRRPSGASQKRNSFRARGPSPSTAKKRYEKFNQRQCTIGIAEGHIYGARVFRRPGSSSQKTPARAALKLRYFRQWRACLEKNGKRPNQNPAWRSERLARDMMNIARSTQMPFQGYTAGELRVAQPRGKFHDSEIVFVGQRLSTARFRRRKGPAHPASPV